MICRTPPQRRGIAEAEFLLGLTGDLVVNLDTKPVDSMSAWTSPT
jgi:hypothetical protein